jgi:Uma2 family endonuclease
MTVEEWRELEQRSEIKHEYIDGNAYAMAGGSLAHGYISTRVIRHLEDGLGNRSCMVYNSDVAARLSSKRYTYPDATVTCDQHDRPSKKLREVKTPRVIVEVLSDTTEAYDRGEKFGYYRECPAVQEYVLVSTRRQLVEVYRRTQEGWILHVYKPGDEVELTSIDVHFPLAALYELTDVPEIVEVPKGEV